METVVKGTNHIRFFSQNATLLPGDSITSASGRYRVRLQSDNHLLIQERTRTEEGKTKWEPVRLSGIARIVTRVWFEPNRRLVVYGNVKGKEQPIYISCNAINAISCVMQDDGNLVLNDSNNRPVWSWYSEGFTAV
ncbi:MAG: hypothetical protein AAF998_16020 [Bacteroidota bacterium]